MKNLALKLSAVVLTCGIGLYYLKFHNKNQPSPYEVNYRIRNDIFNHSSSRSGGIVFLGDSQTQRFEASEYLDVSVKNRGINSDNTTGVLKRLDGIVKTSPSKVFIQIGINDIIEGTPKQEIINNTSTIIKRLGSTKAKLYYVSLIPVSPKFGGYEDINRSVFAINNYMRNFCQSRGITFINVMASLSGKGGLKEDFDTGDGLHVNGAAYRIWADSVRRHLR
jgi:lysophospholipase L1-like esterase